MGNCELDYQMNTQAQDNMLNMLNGGKSNIRKAGNSKKVY